MPSYPETTHADIKLIRELLEFQEIQQARIRRLGKVATAARHPCNCFDGQMDWAYEEHQDFLDCPILDALNELHQGDVYA